MRTRVKICGLTEPGHVAVAVEAGAAYVGFVHFGKSPRHLEVDAMRRLAADVPPGVAKVVLLVDPEDATLAAVCETVPVDMLQLHGRETPERVSEIKARWGLPVMKAIGVSGPDDLARMETYLPVVDQILVDAKAPKDAAIPGGNGIAFDWRLVANRRWPVPWMLAGGLTPDNVADAVSLTGAAQVDVSSGVETAPGRKDADLIRAFLSAAP